MSYKITTKKTWHQTMQDLEEQFRLWGVKNWETNYPKGARSEAWSQEEIARTVKLTFEKDGKTITLDMGRQSRAVDNLRVLFLTIEALRLNEARGTSESLQSAYAQIAAPQAEKNPYEILGIREDASLETAEAVYRSMATKYHPDSKPDGNAEKMAQLNKAIDAIRKEQK